MAPFEQARLEVDLLLCNLVEVEVLVNHALHKLEAGRIPLVNINRADQRLECIAIDVVVEVANLRRENDQLV